MSAQPSTRAPIAAGWHALYSLSSGQAPTGHGHCLASVGHGRWPLLHGLEAQPGPHALDAVRPSGPLPSPPPSTIGLSSARTAFYRPDPSLIGRPGLTSARLTPRRSAIGPPVPSPASRPFTGPPSPPPAPSARLASACTAGHSSLQLATACTAGLSSATARPQLGHSSPQLGHSSPQLSHSPATAHLSLASARPRTTLSALLSIISYRTLLHSDVSCSSLNCHTSRNVHQFTGGGDYCSGATGVT